MRVEAIVKYGTYLPYTGPLSTAEGVVRFAQKAEELGFDHLLVGEHLVFPKRTEAPYPYGPRPVDTGTNQLDLYTLLAYVAGCTERIGLHSGVALVALRSPFETAKAVATLDHLSGGRFVLEVGVGWMRDEFEILGISFAERGAITDETLTVLRVLFEDEGPFEGRYFRFPAVDFHPKPRARPFPIYVGSGCGTRSLRRVARHAQGWTPIGVDLMEFEQALPELAALMDEQGRSMASLDLQGTLKAPEPGGPGEETLVKRTEDMVEAGFTSLVIDIGVLTTPDMDTAERRLRWVSETLRIVP